jgi:hypothetical protein
MEEIPSKNFDTKLQYLIKKYNQEYLDSQEFEKVGAHKIIGATVKILRVLFGVLME